MRFFTFTQFGEAFNTCNNIALAVVAGILIGRQMKQPPAGNKFLFSFKQNQFSKINDIINYINDEYVDTVNDKELVYCIGGRTGGSLAVRAGGRGDVTQTHRLWTNNNGSNVPSPIVHEGHLYWLHENLGVVYCVEAPSGKVVFEERLPNAGQFYGSPVLADGRLYCFGPK